MTGVRTSLTGLLLLGLGLFGCSSGPLQKTVPSLSIDGGPVDFGAQPVLTPTTRIIHFSNVGRAEMTWSAQLTDADAGLLDLDAGDVDAGDAGDDSDSGSPGDGGATDAGAVVDAGVVDAGAPVDAGPLNPNVFTLSVADGGNPASGVLGAGASIDEIVTFNAPVKAGYSANFVLTTDDMQHVTTTIQISGQATTAASIKVAPACLDFGSVPSGIAEVKEITISSVGTAPLEITSITIMGAQQEAFQVLGSSSGGTIQNGAPLTLGVSFEPETSYAVANNAYSATMEIATNDPNHRLMDVCLTGSLEQLPIAVINVTAPTAGATMIPLGASVTLSDAMSSAPPTQTLDSYQWNLVSLPMGSVAQASFTSGCMTSAVAGDCAFSVDVPGEYDIQLTVTDTPSHQSGTTLQKIIGATSEAVEVELTWDTAVGDLDLHFYPVIPTDGGPIVNGINSICDCYGYNQTPMDPSCDYVNPDGGIGGPICSPDKLSGFGPDTVDYVNPNAGEYQIAVIYYSDQGNPGLTPTATVRVFLYGSVAGVFTQPMTTVGQQWNVGWIDWPSEKIESGLAP